MRILIVDDDELVGRSLARVLRKHTVVVEPDPSRAVARVAQGEESGTPFDVVLCDLNMPRIAGDSIARALLARCSSPITIVMSGDAHALSTMRTADGALLKPFRSSDLEGVVSNAARARARAA